MRKSLQIKKIITAWIIMLFGSFLFKFIPMEIWGKDILFDASFHIESACFILYIIWFFIDQDKSWRTPFFVFCALVLSIISFQRIAANAHNDIGLLEGLIIALIAIGYAERKNLKGKFKF